MEKNTVETEERHMLAFSLLAAESKTRQQAQGELRFLILAGTAACQAGYSQVTQMCYQRIKELNPHHMLTNYSSLEEALKSEDFQTLVNRLDRFCTYEHAELLLEKHRPGWESESIPDLEAHCLGILSEEPD